MMTECAEISVLYNDAEMHGVRFHKVPRDLFDLFPGEERYRAPGIWTKSVTLAHKPMKFMLFCSEDPAPTLARDEGTVDGVGPLLGGPETKLDGSDAPNV